MLNIQHHAGGCQAGSAAAAGVAPPGRAASGAARRARSGSPELTGRPRQAQTTPPGEHPGGGEIHRPAGAGRVSR